MSKKASAAEPLNRDELQKATDELAQAAQKIGESLYQSSNAQAGPQPGAENGGPSESAKKDEEEVVDADYTVKD